MAFDHFSNEALRFLTDLKANNTRDWFTANKPAYESEIKKPAKDFCASMAAALTGLTGRTIGWKVFRINRDVRFSKDKTPYNAHLHISFMPENSDVMWFWGLGVENLALGCGIFEFGKDRLEAFRADMAGPRGADFITMKQEMAGKGLRVSEPVLKRVPAGYDKDHPHGEALRHKGFSVWRDLDRSVAAQPGLVEACQKDFEAMMPVWGFFKA